MATLTVSTLTGSELMSTDIQSFDVAPGFAISPGSTVKVLEGFDLGKPYSISFVLEMSSSSIAPVTLPEPAPATTPRPKTAQEALLHAALYIEEHGWTHGRPTDDEGRVCVAQALMVVTGGNNDGKSLVFHGSPYSNPLFIEAATRLDAQLPGGGQYWDHIVNWNDKPGRTQSEVVAALRWAAKDPVAP